MKKSGKYSLLFLAAAAALFLSSAAVAQDYSHTFRKLDKLSEEILLFERMSDVAYVDKVRLTGPPKAVRKETGCAFLDSLSGNDLVFHSYIFIPKKVRQSRKYPLIVFPHGGIHGTFATNYVHILKELIAQGYIIVAPDYRGSTGYGQGFYKAIDYGGLENEDVLSARDYMVENYSIVDSTRVGILGWSHGGMIALMNVLQWPEKYACAYSGVPVSDVTYRLTYQEESYKDYFSADYHVGRLPDEAPEEYARRSPVSYASRLSRPLMITTCENDDDVSVDEVRRMIDALKAANKDFEYEIYPRMHGAHLFERIDIREASDIRFRTYQFLAKYLNPPKPFKSPKELRRAGYYFY